MKKRRRNMSNLDLKKDWSEFAQLYCERNDSTEEELIEALRVNTGTYQPMFFALMECQMLGSHQLGQRTIVPVGGAATWQNLPDKPVSLRGLASDMSSMIAFINVEDVPNVEDTEPHNNNT